MKTPDGSVPGIPKGWTTARLEEVADLFSGGTPSKSRSEWWQGPIPWASPKDMKRLRLRDTLDHVSEEAIEAESRLVPAKTIFVVVRGMILAKSLPVAMAEVSMAFNQDMKAVVARPGIDPEYLLYALASRRDALARDIGTSAHGTRRLGSSSLETLAIPVPPRGEQRVIAFVLSKLEAMVDVQARLVATLKTLKTATMTKLFREGLRGNRLKSTEVGEIPESWDVAEIGDVVDKIQYGLSIRGQEDGRYPILRMNCQEQGRVVFRDLQYIDLPDSVFLGYALRDGDLLFNRTNSIDLVGRTAVFHGIREAVYASYLLRLRVRDSVVLPDWLNYYLGCEAVQRSLKALASRGVSQANISAGKLKSFPIPVAPLDEQKAIVEYLDQLTHRCDIGERKRTILSELFATALTKVMSGEWRFTPRAAAQSRVPSTATSTLQRSTPDASVVQSIVGRIVDAIAPEKIILFGSAARGEMGPDSDLDLLVVKRGMSPRQATRAAYASLYRDRQALGVPVDVIVVTPEDVERYEHLVGTIIKPALAEGRVLYAA